ncbi:MAG: tetratricopeptide repeat protein [Phycisphaerae bacterium]
MNIRNALMFAVVLTGAFAASSAGQEPSTTNPEAPKPSEGDVSAELSQAVEDVWSADSAAAAAEAYAGGCSVSKTHAPLHRAYMHRMLELGMPRIAAHPAKTLTRLNPEQAPLAWAVVGYRKAKRNYWTDSLEATLRAAEELPDNEAVLHNAGQLVAWYEHSPDKPRASDRAKRAISKLRAEHLPKGGEFAGAYRAITAAYEQQAQAVAEARREIAEIKDRINELKDAYHETRRELAAVETEITHFKDVLDDLESDLRRLRRRRHRALIHHSRDTGTTVVIHEDYDPYRVETAELRGGIREVNRELGELRGLRTVLRRERDNMLSEIRGKRNKLADRERELEFDLELELRRHFRWDAPDPSGRAVAERIYPAETAIENPPTAGGEGRVARSRLRLAELYLRHDMTEKAAETLRDIVKDYPDSDAAGQSVALLESINTADSD